MNEVALPRGFVGTSLTVAVQMLAEDRAEVTRWIRSPSLRARCAADRIVLLAAGGTGHVGAAAGRLEVTHRSSRLLAERLVWRLRF